MSKLNRLQQKCDAQAREIRELKAALAQSLEINKNLVAEVERLKHQVAELTRYRFGARSERFEDGNDPQMPLFGELIEEPQPDAGGPEKDEPEPASNDSTHPNQDTKRKSKKKRIDWPDDLKVVERVIDVDDSNLHCTCGCELKEFGQDVTDRISYQPESFFIDREIRIKRSCSCGKGIAVAPAPKRILPGVSVTDELLAQMIISKCLDRQPLYHLSGRWLNRHDVNIPRDNLSRWFIKTAKALQPIYNLMQDQISDYDIASLDATSIQVLKEPGRQPQTKSKAWCFIGGAPGQEVTLFAYNASEHVEFIKHFLHDFDGKLHGDADNCYTNLGQIMSYCNAHNRRKYEPISKAATTKGIAYHVMVQYQRLYEIEQNIKDLPPDEKRSIRQEKAKPIFDALKQYLSDRLMGIPNTIALADAVAYTLTHWEGLTEYLNDGRLSIDNNHTERTIRKFVMARNNFLFADTVEGAKALCLHMSLIQTAIQHDLEPYEYYVKLLKKIPHCNSVEDYEQLMPWVTSMHGTASSAA